MTFVYNIIIKLYLLSIYIVSPFNEKAKNWIVGRKNQIPKLKNLKDSEEIRYWFHCASLGEFEQGRPVIEKIKIQNPEIKIVLTFFSPSGFLHSQNYEHADYIFYLPIDTNKNAKEFINYIKPKKVFFIKYEFWYHYLSELSENKIPTYLISGIFSENQLFFRWYGNWYKNLLGKFTILFVQNEKSKALLNTEGFHNVVISGDSRFDRVYEIAQNNLNIPIFEKFKSDSKTLIIGSSWEKDEEIIIDYINKNPNKFKYIIAPHDTTKNNISRICTNLKTSFIKYSENENDEKINNYNVLIIDIVGILSKIYKYADISYIGGGFGKGIHNILEANVFGCPVIFGPNYNKFSEAVETIKLKTCFSINNKFEFEKKINYLSKNQSELDIIKNKSERYFITKKGASDTILKNIS